MYCSQVMCAVFSHKSQFCPIPNSLSWIYYQELSQLTHWAYWGKSVDLHNNPNPPFSHIVFQALLLESLLKRCVVFLSTLTGELTSTTVYLQCSIINKKNASGHITSSFGGGNKHFESSISVVCGGETHP